ncbi:MAG: M14 family metallocarboxypeptidase [Xanthomonadales bacterium]|nr:M14 family metallocarboxypeptidase [Xanthomonadales bacterium]
MTETDSAAPAPYPIGTPGQPWGDAERAEWLSRQRKQRDYMDDVVSRIDGLRDCFDVMAYGRLEYADGDYTLYALKSRGWRDDLPCALVTGGVHGYETSGVHGALRFAETLAKDYMDKVNLLVAPCISPWAYERIHRWNPHAIDPNRSFRADSPAGESAALWRLLEPLRDRFLMHIDLHETTDSDEEEFRPALAARDGKPHEPGIIPDVFYLVDDSASPEADFQQAVLAEVAKVTHIAEADANGEIIESPVVAPGVIEYPFKELGLCAGITHARFTTTTEVYPDSPRASPEQCIDAQVAAVRGALDFALAAAANAKGSDGL